MDRDSLGAIVSQPPATRSIKSSPAEPKNTRFNQNDAAAVIARLLAQWPYRREEVLDDRIYKLMQRELVEHFGTYDRTLVDQAVTLAIARSDNWPAASVLLKCVNELREAQPKTGRPTWRDDDDGRYMARTPEEVARRKAQCLQWRKDYGFNANASAKTQDKPDDLESLNRPFTPDELASAGRLRKKGEDTDV